MMTFPHKCKRKCKCAEMIDSNKFRKMNKISQEKMLVQAAMENNFSIMQHLINLGVSVDASEYNKSLQHKSQSKIMTPLMYAAENGNLQCLQLLIKHSADLNAEGQFHNTATQIAAERGYYYCLKALLHAGADFPTITEKYSKNTTTSTTPLHLAAKKHANCVRLLIKYGADYNALDGAIETPLNVAAKSGSDKCIHTLLKYAHGPDVLSVPGYFTGDTPLHWAVRQGMVESVRELLNIGSDVNHLNQSGNSPLHECLTCPTLEPAISLKILKLLVLYGRNTDVNLIDNRGFTPLHLVAFNAVLRLKRRHQMAVFLISYGADIHIYSHEGSSLMEYEYNCHDSDESILNACVNSLNILPSPQDLKDEYFIADSVPTDSFRFFEKWFAICDGRPLRSPMFANFRRNIKLMNSIIEKYFENKRIWYDDISSNPLSLSHTCRNVVRSCLGCRNLKNIKDLPIPNSLKSYLVFGAEVP